MENFKTLGLGLLLSVLLCNCSNFPEPSPGSTTMDNIDVNSPQWATLSPTQKEAVIGGYEEEDPQPYTAPY